MADCPAAVVFSRTFPHREDVDYAWVVPYAKEEYARAIEAFKRLDDKAAAVANYLGAGTGLLTLGSVAGVAAGHVHAWVIVSALPSFGLAVLAMLLALRARAPMPRPSPSAADIVGYADYFEGKGEVALIGKWHLATELVYRVNEFKGDLVDAAYRWFFWSAAALALPIAVTLVRKFANLP